MNAGLRVGVTIVTMPRFELEDFLRLHQEYGVTRSFVAPPIVLALAKHPMVDQYDLSSLRQVFSAPRRCRPSSRSRPASASAARWCRATA